MIDPLVASHKLLQSGHSLRQTIQILFSSCVPHRIFVCLRNRCTKAYEDSVRDAGRKQDLDCLAQRVSTLEQFVRGYEWIDDPSISTDDEILNWAFSEVAFDLCSAIWLLASCFYKTSASSLRTAFEIGIASLYFQMRENTEPKIGAYNKFFEEWDSGVRQTPNWGEMTKFMTTSRPSVVSVKIRRLTHSRKHTSTLSICVPLLILRHSQLMANRLRP